MRVSKSETVNEEEGQEEECKGIDRVYKAVWQNVVGRFVLSN